MLCNLRSWDACVAFVSTDALIPCNSLAAPRRLLFIIARSRLLGGGLREGVVWRVDSGIEPRRFGGVPSRDDERWKLKRGTSKLRRQEPCADPKTLKALRVEGEKAFDNATRAP